MKTTPKTLKKTQTELTTNEELFSFFRLFAEHDEDTPYPRPELVDVFRVEYQQLPLENLFEVKGFQFIADPSNRRITEIKSGAKIEIRRVNVSTKEPFSSVVGKMAQWLRGTKNWDEINHEVMKMAFAHREPHLNLLIL